MVVLELTIRINGSADLRRVVLLPSSIVPRLCGREGGNEVTILTR